VSTNINSISEDMSSKIAELQSVDFNVFAYSDDELLQLTVNMFRDMGLIDRFQIPMDIFKNFVMGVRACYRQNPFHNFKHGFSVLQFCYVALRVSSATSKLTEVDVLALMIGCVCHDLDHPGNTNSFEISSQSGACCEFSLFFATYRHAAQTNIRTRAHDKQISRSLCDCTPCSLADLALVHNDLHVLENHHAHQTFLLLRKPECNILKNCRADTQAQVRGIMV
jgi:hypothetical protein